MDRQKLKKWREDRGLLQPELAELLGTHWKTIAAWEQGRQKLPPFLHLALEELARRLSQQNLKKTA